MSRPITDFESADALEAEDPDEYIELRRSMERGLLVIGNRTELILVRHAQQIRTKTQENQPGGPELSALGREQARLTGVHLSSEKIDAVYCSDMNRAVETARIIAGVAAPDIDPVLDGRLQEIDMLSPDRGPSLLSVDEVDAASAVFEKTLRFDAYPNTEPAAEFRERMRSVLEEIVASHVDQRVIVVSHSGIISAFIAGLIAATPDMFFFAGHASVNRLFHGDGRFITHALNEVTHLRERGALTF